MKMLAPSLLPMLEQHYLEGLDAGPGLVYPYYQGYSIANLPSSVCRWLGAPDFGMGPLAPDLLSLLPGPFKHVVMIVVDGWGFNAVQATLAASSSDPDLRVWSELPADACFAPITSISPSTTAAAIATLWTGQPPSAHGIVAYEVWLKEYSLIANMIYHSPASFLGEVGSLQRAGFNPEMFLPVPTLGPHLLQHGVKSYAFQHHSIARSGLSVMLFPGVEIVPYRSLGDLWVTLGSVLEQRPEESNYCYVYWGDLDELSHRFGPDDARVRRELAAFSLQLSYFLRERSARRRSDTLFVLTADHGHIPTPSNPHYELRNHPKLLSCLVMLPSGEARMPFVYLRPGREEQFLKYLDATWPGQFHMIPSTLAIRSGLFGSEIYERFLDRVGDYVIVPQDGAFWWFSPQRDNWLLGRHGGLSHTEMISPLLMFTV